MQLKRIPSLAILPLPAGTALGASCYDKGQQWEDVGTHSVLDEAFRRVCDKTNLAGEYKRHEAIKTCENVAGHSFPITIQHIDSMYSLDPWFLSSETCFNLLKKVYNACSDRGGSMILTAGGGEDKPWMNADVRLDPENTCCGC